MTDDNITVKRLYSLVAVMEQAIDDIEELICDIENGDVDTWDAAHNLNGIIEKITIEAE